MTTKKFLTAEEVADFFGIEESVLDGLVTEGSLKALADRGTWKFKREEVEALIKSGRLHPSKPLPESEDSGDDMILLASDDGPNVSAVDFLELDEDALAEQPTMITSGSTPELQDFFENVHVEPEGSSSDVRIVLEPAESTTSDSDIKLASTVAAEDAEAGATSHSDVRVLSDSNVDAIDDGGILIDEELDFGGHAASAEQAGQTLELPTTSSSDLGLEQYATAEPTLEIPTHGDSELTLEDADSGISLETGDSGITLETGDSGITLETGDSGIALESADSGMALDDDDSGISLDAGDSGISIEVGDSGLSLETAGDSGLALDYLNEEEAPKPKAGMGATEPMFSIKDDVDDAPSFSLADTDSTQAEMAALSDDELDKTVAFAALDADDSSSELDPLADLDEPPAKGGKKRGTDALGLSGAIAAGATIDDLEVVEGLDEMFEDDDTVEAIDDVVEADDSAFSDEFAEAVDDDEAPLSEEEFEVAAAAPKGPREPTWGVFTALCIFVATGILGTNGWLLWEGLSTMWTGAPTSGPAASLLSTLGGLF